MKNYVNSSLGKRKTRVVTFKINETYLNNNNKNEIRQKYKQKK